MNRRTTFFTATVVAAMVFAGSTPVQAADATAVKRAIVITVLNNLGVQPTAELVDAIVADIPMDVLDSGLVRKVGTALDTDGDVMQIIGQIVDSDGDGVPNENGARDASSEEDDSSDSNSDSGSSTPGGGTSTRPPNNNDDGDSDSEDDEDPKDDDDDDDDDEDDEDDEDGDDEDN